MRPARLKKYILVDGRPVIEDNLLKWAAFYENSESRVLRQDFFVYKNRALVLIDEKTYRAAQEHKKRFDRELTVQELEHNRKARKKKVELGGVPIKLSTIFLGIDQSYTDDGPPILWETMMFGVDHTDFGQHRYHNDTQALKGHMLLLETLMGLAKVGKLEKLLRNDEDEEKGGAAGSEGGT